MEGEDEYQVEEILDERRVRRGRGSQLQYKVKWTGYARPTWEPATALQECQALDRWLARTPDNQSPTSSE